ncbi:DJ-1/PfpI family protein [Elsinoe ampelina]|uniref:DJ-1/PfpI family protein n=1 Tax=Elsinoe ampelina TaxID=302913 RepID=A0A6A6GMD5_9PEZI|nr:DJ-1/PfpI family protein [Elsinoe ampelina]
MASSQPSSTSPQKPLHISLLLFPAFQALDAFGPLDALNILSYTTPLHLSILAPTLHPVSTKPLTPNLVGSNFSESIAPTHTYASPPPDIDVLLVPGGLGTRAQGTKQVVDFIRATYPGVKYMIAVCTGSWLAARAGVLDGRRATSNKASWGARVEQGSGEVKWVAHARWVVDGNVWTSSGVSAGIDATLDWIKTVWGREQAMQVADRMEYDWHEDGAWDPWAEKYGLKDDEE